MGFKQKYKFNVIGHLYYMSRILCIYKWYMPLEAISFAVFSYIPPFLMMKFLFQVIHCGCCWFCFSAAFGQK